MRIHINNKKSCVSANAMGIHYDKSVNIVKDLFSQHEPMTEWVNWPKNISEEYLANIEEASKLIQDRYEQMIVIGIGGSYLGTYALLDALGGHINGYPDIAFAGQNLCGEYQKSVADKIDQKNTCICVISKSGTTMETSIAYSIFKDKLIQKYGMEEACKRIIIITDANSGFLRDEANKMSCMSFPIPNNIGGRYSVLTAVGLFPLAVAGYNIRKLIAGAREICNEDYWINGGINYSLIRYAQFTRGKEIEIFEYYNPYLHYFGEWTKQLFGESEGKEGRGIFPVSLTLSTDLHSIGQYLQEGKQVFFETVININKYNHDIIIPDIDGNPYGGMSLNKINQYAVKGVIAAHSKVDIPIVQITADSNNEQCFGQLVYFFEMSAAISAKLMNVNPFNQDGVEKYKKEIKNFINGYGD